MVRHFHEKFGAPVQIGSQGISRPELRAELIREEARETIDAIHDRNLAKAIDGICDLLYVCYGAALEFGVDLDVYFREVHHSNMRKEGGATRSDGKLLKPEGWKAPDIAGLLADGEGMIK
jgi:predicted HAD superfamily Cof-like phosphohydrolase